MVASRVLVWRLDETSFAEIPTYVSIFLHIVSRSRRAVALGEGGYAG